LPGGKPQGDGSKADLPVSPEKQNRFPGPREPFACKHFWLRQANRRSTRCSNFSQFRARQIISVKISIIRIIRERFTRLEQAILPAGAGAKPPLRKMLQV
jgi:hypothetical protein